jgi:hypothetical protein
VSATLAPPSWETDRPRADPRREARIKKHERNALTLSLRALRPALPDDLIDALADGHPIDRADGIARDLSESEALRDWHAGVALVVRS